MSGVYPPMPENGPVYWERTSGGRSGIISVWAMVIEEFGEEADWEGCVAYATHPIRRRKSLLVSLSRRQASTSVFFMHITRHCWQVLPARHWNFAVSWPWKLKYCHQTLAGYSKRRSFIPLPGQCTSSFGLSLFLSTWLGLFLRFTPPIRRWQVGDQPESPMGFR